jgi:hypothetical protein
VIFLHRASQGFRARHAGKPHLWLTFTAELTSVTRIVRILAADNLPTSRV